MGKIWEREQKKYLERFFTEGSESDSIVDSNWTDNNNNINRLWTKISLI